jgi:LacI family transcriptional regulator
MPPPRPTLRTLAEKLGLSIATVSESLRDSPRVAPATRARVQALATRLGYARNPLLSAVMSVVRTSRQEGLRGTIAALNWSDAPSPVLMPFHRSVFAGAEARAAELGYRLELFWMGPHGLSYRRVNQILSARQIEGVIVLPFPEARDLSEIEWSRLSAVSMDYCVSRPTLHSVLPDHHLVFYDALLRLRERGYRRPGLFMLHHRDVRLKHRFSSTYLGFMQAFMDTPSIPPLGLDPPAREPFLEWFRTHRPDVIVSHVPATVAWLESIGVRVPRDVGFVILNCTDRIAPCAGLDMRPTAMGAASVESVVAQIQRNERGPPAIPKSIMIGGAWTDGPTIRPAPAARKS